MRYPVGKDKRDYEINWYVAQGYGKKVSYGYHDGVDLNLKSGGNTDLGCPLYAIADGEVTSVHKHASGWGWHFHIKHVGRWGTCWSHYAHCDSIRVAVGDRVQIGQVVATLGNTGNSTAAHLHFSIKKKPTGTCSVAKTLTELKAGWYDPIPFINSYYGDNMGASPELQECLRQHGVLVDELTKVKQENETLKARLESMKTDCDNEKHSLDMEIKKLNVELNDLLGIETLLQREKDLRREDNLRKDLKIQELEGEITKLKQQMNSDDLTKYDYRKLLDALIKKLIKYIRYLKAEVTDA